MIFTTEDIQKHIRIAIYGFGGYFIGRGWDVGLVSFILGAMMLTVNYGWTIYGLRLSAKVAEMEKIARRPDTPVRGVIVDNSPEGRELAKELPLVANEGSV